MHLSRNLAHFCKINLKHRSLWKCQNHEFNLGWETFLFLLCYPFLFHLPTLSWADRYWLLVSVAFKNSLFIQGIPLFPINETLFLSSKSVKDNNNLKLNCCNSDQLHSALSHLNQRRGNNVLGHGLRTPNEGMNQRYLKNWADMADKICCRHT